VTRKHLLPMQRQVLLLILATLTASSAATAQAPLPHIPIRDLKRYALRPLTDLLFGWLGKFPHSCSFINFGNAKGYWDEVASSLSVRRYYDALERVALRVKSLRKETK
jgi:hypothetical protein